MVRRLIAIFAVAAASLPAVAIGLDSLAAAATTAVGRNPYWRQEPVNMAEAAAVRDLGTVVQLIRRGEDAHLRREVRADLLFNDRVELTPFEAAIAAQRPDMLELLIADAPIQDQAEWVALRCLSEMEGDDETNELLDRNKPAGASMSCDGFKRPW